MKPLKFKTVTALCLMALVCAFTSFALADDNTPPSQASVSKAEPVVSKPENKSLYSGVITKLDSKERTMLVKKSLFTRTFNLTKDCVFILHDGKDGKLEDFQTGNQVEVSYQNVSGVLIASEVRLQEMTFAGDISAIDKEKHAITVHSGWMNKTFLVKESSRLFIKDKGEGSLEDLKIGHKVDITYENNNGALEIRKLRQNSLTFEGVISAVDTSARTVKAKVLLSEKQFNLASDCRVMVEGKNSSLSNLKLGQSATIAYKNVEGVLVASAVVQSPEAGTAAATGAKHSDVAKTTAEH